MRPQLIRGFMVLISVLCASRVAAESEIIIDNPNAEVVGAWTTGTVTLTKYGDDYYYCSQSLTGTNSATYLPYIPVAASDWSIYAWYPAGSNRPTQARYIIHTTSGDNTVYVNQQINGQQWFCIGTYAVDSGVGNWVRITNQGPETDKVVMADAVRFYSPTTSSEPDTSPPIISSVTSRPEPTRATVTWTTDEPATSQVEFGDSVSYGSETPKQTALVLDHSVTITGLSFPTTYHFRVKSEDLYDNAAASADLTFTASSEIPQTPAFRSAWADGWSPGFRSAAEVTELVDTLHQANYNVVIPEVRKCGDAFYDSAYENRATAITDPLPFDPLAEMITKAHAVGMEVHAWLVAYRIANSSATNAPPVYYEHPEWLTRDSSGAYLNKDFYLLDQGVPGVQDYVCKIVLDIASKYDVDGVNFDYIRYQGNTWGYNEITRQRFYDEYGFWPPNSSSETGWTTWCDYRRQQVTDLVKKCYLEVMALKPHVKMTADTITGGSVTDFTISSPYSSVLQDWHKWMEDHILDASIPMDYRDDSVPAEAKAFRDWAQFSVDSRYGRHSYVGMSTYRNTIGNSIGQIYAAMSMGADGVSTYNYSNDTKDGLPSTELFSAVGSSIYTSPVPTPDMPWKTAPTTGIIFGTVTDASHPNDPIYRDWVYKATVTAIGPVTRTTLTDATGTYGFIDLPPGAYVITCSKAGFPTRTYGDQRIEAGDVLRENFELGYTTASSSDVAVNGWSLFSLPLEPVNPDPASVLDGVNIDGRLYRWDNPTQGLSIYDSWSPEQFGNLDTKSGYWLQSSSAGTISYQARAGAPATSDIHLQSAGWAIIGCPFPTDKQWPNVLVRHGSETVPIGSAGSNAWMDTGGYWWDAANQGLMDIGLPENFASCETLQPWHGYWVRTYLDDLTMILR
ncbi:MAG: family 10 glycosylhydrolase [Armatimonadetes bacterium]|nr:family 10 glycosylhydrolase [Armatimonadota bacterium]